MVRRCRINGRVLRGVIRIGVGPYQPHRGSGLKPPPEHVSGVVRRDHHMAPIMRRSLLVSADS